jgi:hypothetical protein
MTLEEYSLLEQDFTDSDTDIKTFLKERGLSYNTYYYWKRKSRELKEDAHSVGQFLPIDVQMGRAMKPSKRSKNLKQPIVTQGEIEIELRTPSGAEIRIRGFMDSIMVSTIIASSGGRHNV